MICTEHRSAATMRRLPHAGRLGGTIGLLLLSLASAWAQPRPAGSKMLAPQNGMTMGELSLLPPYCMDAQGIIYGDQYGGNASPRAPYWISKMGENFWAIHHYCNGLAFTRRSEAPGVTPMELRSMSERIVKEYEYVLRNTDPDFVLVPEILVKMAQTQLKLGNTTAAYAALERARQVKPDYWPAYSTWVEVLVRLKKRQEARDLAATGLAYAPDSEVLRQQFKMLGGDLTKITPIAATIAAPSATASAPTSEPAASAAQ